jgi:hypothetical protein
MFILLGFTVKCSWAVAVLWAAAGLAPAMVRLAIAMTGAATSGQVERLLNDQRLCTHPPLVQIRLRSDAAYGHC